MATYSDDIAILVISLIIGFLIMLNITIRLYENEGLNGVADEYVEIA